MAVLKPFCALRFDIARAEGATPQHPYAQLVEQPGQIKGLAARYAEPSSAIHLAYPRSLGEATGSLAVWRASGFVRQDPLPAFYPYYQQSNGRVRKGFITLIKVSETEKPQAIWKHEATLEGQVQAHIRLLEALQLQVTPTHGLYRDPALQLEPLLDEYMLSPVTEFTDERGVKHSLGMIQNGQEVAFIAGVLATQQVLLADGHHRLAAAEQYLAAWKTSHASEALHYDGPEAYHLIYLSNTCPADEAQIQPIHRVIEPEEGFDTAGFLDRLAQHFILTPLTTDSPIKDTPVQADGFVLLLGNDRFGLQLKPEISPITDNPLELPASVKELQYTILHYFILERLLGIPYAGNAATVPVVTDLSTELLAEPESARIHYVKDIAEVRHAVEAGSMAFLMPALPLGKLWQVCADGALMPPKSTYFTPKVLSGLVYAALDESCIHPSKNG